MREAGVPPNTVESWGIFFNQLTIRAGTCKPSELHKVGAEMASAFKTAMWYMEKEGAQ